MYVKLNGAEDGGEGGGDAIGYLTYLQQYFKNFFNGSSKCSTSMKLNPIYSLENAYIQEIHGNDE